MEDVAPGGRRCAQLAEAEAAGWDEGAKWMIEVMRLVRVQIGTLKLGNLGKGEVRLLREAEVQSLADSPT